MRRIHMVALLVILSMVFTFSLTFAIEMKPIKPIERERLQVPVAKPKTDLKVDGIFARNCKCDIADVDALYMGSINVSVSNNYMQSGGVSTESVLTVTYYDLGTGQMKTVTKNLPSLNPYPTNPWALQEYQVVTTPVLVKKSVGITAEIKPAGIVVDSNAANNVMTEKDCKIMVY